MLLAGEDTTAFTLARTIHQLCDRSRWAAELRSEADAVIGSGNVAVDLDTANRLARANAVANETMRLRPVAAFLGFLANVDMALGDVLFRRERVSLLSCAPRCRSSELRRPARLSGLSRHEGFAMSRRTFRLAQGMMGRATRANCSMVDSVS
jgi:cytochrome P450